MKFWKDTLWVFTFIVNVTFAQEDIKVDQLTAPSSPGILILGSEISNVEKPTNPTDLMVSLINSSESSSLIPQNYALDLTPYWLFGGGKTTYEEMVHHKDLFQNIIQSFQLSIAFKTLENENQSEDSTLLGFGFKFSLLRGKISNEFNNKVSNEIMPSLDELTKNIGERIQQDSVVILINKQVALTPATDTVQLQNLAALLDMRVKEITASIQNDDQFKQQIEELSQEVKLTRYGFKMDLAGAWAVHFPSQSFSNRELSRFGVWLTAGYETDPSDKEGTWSFLGVARYLQNYNEAFKDANDLILQADNSYFDIGARLIYTYHNKVSLSGEIVNRSNTSGKNIKETTRFVFNLNYQLPDNKLITFSYGKDFNNAINKSGDLVAALGLIVGIGSKRPLK